MRRMTLLLAAMAFCAFSPVAAATEVKGRVIIRGALTPPPESGPRTYYWSLDNGVLAPREDRIFPDRDLMVLLAPRGRRPTRTDTAPVIVHVSSGGLRPAAVAVRSGTLVRFQNDDPFTHELYSPSHPDFAAESMAPGQTRPLVAPGSGQVEIRCRRTAHLRGFVAIVDAQYYVSPAADGSFTLQAEPGTYLVRIFFEGRWLPESELVINSERSQNVELTVDASTARPRPPAPAALPTPGAGGAAPAGTPPPPAAPAPAVPR